MKTLSFAALAGLFVLAPRVAEARSFRVNDIPNGKSYGCISCHTSNTGHKNTSFGDDSEAFLVGGGSKSTRHTDWAALCPLDSDGDGFTNGEELNDPACTWKRGQANPGGETSNPGKASSVLAGACGDGVLDPGEDCDGAASAAASCDEIGQGDGLLGCTAGCKYDTSQCAGGSGSGATSGGNTTGGSGGGSSSRYASTPPILPSACSYGPATADSALAVAVGVAALAIVALKRRSRG